MGCLMALVSPDVNDLQKIYKLLVREARWTSNEKYVEAAYNSQIIYVFVSHR